MSNVGWITLVPNEDGEISLSSFPRSEDNKQKMELYSLSSLALLNHVFTTLPKSVVIRLITNIIQGIVTGNLSISLAVGSVKQVTLELKRGPDFVYTLLKPKVKMFSRNQDVEASMYQIVNNTVSFTLRDQDYIHHEAFKAAMYGLIVGLESLTRVGGYSGKMGVVNLGILMINKYPQNFCEEGLLERYIAETNPNDLITRLSNVPGDQDRPFFG